LVFAVGQSIIYSVWLYRGNYLSRIWLISMYNIRDKIVKSSYRNGTLLSLLSGEAVLKVDTML